MNTFLDVAGRAALQNQLGDIVRAMGIRNMPPANLVKLADSLRDDPPKGDLQRVIRSRLGDMPPDAWQPVAWADTFYTPAPHETPSGARHTREYGRTIHVDPYVESWSEVVHRRKPAEHIQHLLDEERTAMPWLKPEEHVLAAALRAVARSVTWMEFAFLVEEQHHDRVDQLAGADDAFKWLRRWGLPRLVGCAPVENHLRTSTDSFKRLLEADRRCKRSTYP
jgi:hypothetical protein